MAGAGEMLSALSSASIDLATNPDRFPISF